MKELELGREWELKPVKRFDGNYEDGRAWLKQVIPAHWQELPELENYAGKVVYRRRFSFQPDPKRRYWLRLNGIFYWASAYLNGCRLGANEGYFFPVEYEITEIVEGDNELLIEVDCPDEADKSLKHMVTGVFHHWDCLDPATNPGGIWLPVEIHSTGALSIREACFHTAYITPEYARVEGKVRLDSVGPEKIKVRIHLKPRNFEGPSHHLEREILKAQGEQTYFYTLDVKDYQLWWTHDHGRPNLYSLQVEVLREGLEEPDHVYTNAFGIRTFEMRNYIGYLNGRRIYMRGNNYPPGDTRLATMTRKRYERDLELALSCHLNMLRLHAHVEHPLFYEVCDERGILIWQDFPLQWYYRKDIEASALYQVEKMITMLYNHACIGLWCMHNEPIRQVDMHKWIGPLTIIRSLFSMFFWNWNRDVLDRRLSARARHLSPYRYVHRLAGERGLFRKNTGDGHLYFGWYFGPLRWLNYLIRKKSERLKFVTEFGSQSFPNYENSIRFMESELENLDWKHLQARHHLQAWLMKLWVNPKRSRTLKEYINATQNYQSKVNRYHIDRLRYLKYRPNGGCLAFVFLDSNPAIQWSVVDYWREPKSSYYAMQKAMSPVYAFGLLDKETYPRGRTAPFPVYAVNDTWNEVDAKIEVAIISASGDEILSESHQVKLASDSEARAIACPRVRLNDKGKYRLEIKLSWNDRSLQNSYRFKVK